MSFDQWLNHYVMTLQGAVSHNAEMGRSAIGNITRLDNALSKMAENLEQVKIKAEQLAKQFEDAKVEVQKTFEQEAELKEALERQAFLASELDLDGNGESEIVDEHGASIKEFTEQDVAEPLIPEHEPQAESTLTDKDVKSVDDHQDSLTPRERINELRARLKQMDTIHEELTEIIDNHRDNANVSKELSDSHPYTPSESTYVPRLA